MDGCGFNLKHTHHRTITHQIYTQLQQTVTAIVNICLSKIIKTLDQMGLVEDPSVFCPQGAEHCPAGTNKHHSNHLRRVCPPSARRLHQPLTRAESPGGNGVPGPEQWQTPKSSSSSHRALSCCQECRAASKTEAETLTALSGLQPCLVP